MAKHERTSGKETRNTEEASAAHVGQTAVNSEAAAAETAERHEKLTEDVDALLDDIDEVLETNPEEFVRGYVQKGGQ